MSRKNSSIFDFNSEDVRTGAVECPEETGSVSPEDSAAKRTAAKWIYVLAVAVISVVLALVLIGNVVERVNEGLVMELQVGDVIPSRLEDGQYTGSYSTAGMGASVTVDITAGYIINISLDGFADIDTSRAQTVFDAVIAAQSLETGRDDIGSVPSDRILLLAIENALNGGGVQ